MNKILPDGTIITTNVIATEDTDVFLTDKQLISELMRRISMLRSKVSELENE